MVPEIKASEAVVTVLLKSLNTGCTRIGRGAGTSVPGLFTRV